MALKKELKFKNGSIMVCQILINALHVFVVRIGTAFYIVNKSALKEESVSQR